MVHGSTISDSEIVEDLNLSGFNIEFDFDETCSECRDHARLSHIVSCHTNQARVYHASDSTGSHRIDIIGHGMSTICSTQFDRLLSSTGV